VKKLNSFLSIDKLILDKQREISKLLKPSEFEKSRITPVEITNLLPLIRIPFDESAVARREHNGFTSIGVPVSLQQARIYEIFGVDHIRFSHKVVERETVEGKEGKKDMHYYKVYVKISIGNQTLYTDQEQKPTATFVEYYYVEGIGYDGHINKGTAEKNALANGKKECFKAMGMLDYLYLEGDTEANEWDTNDLLEVDTEGVYTCPTTKITLLDKPKLNDQGKVFLKCKAIDTEKDKEIEILIYRENPMFVEAHKVMIATLKKHQQHLIKDKELHVEYKEHNYGGKDQYIISKIFFKETKKENE
jgi:hypothetical protein